MFRWFFYAVFFVTMFFVCLVYMVIVVVCGSVGVLRMSRVASRRGAVDIRGGVFLAVYRYVSWSRKTFVAVRVYAQPSYFV